MKTLLLVVNQVVLTGLVIQSVVVFLDVAHALRNAKTMPPSGTSKLREVFLWLAVYVTWDWGAVLTGVKARTGEYAFVPAAILLFAMYQFWRSLHNGPDQKTTTGSRHRS